MTYQYWSKLAILILGISVFSAASAQGEIPPLTMQESNIAAYKELALFYNISGTKETLTWEGHVFVSITATFEPPWSDSFKRLKVDWKDIKLSSGGMEMPMIAFTEYYGVNKIGTNSWSKSRPSSWKEQSAPIPYNAIFLVPDAERSLKLSIGSSSWNFEVPEPLATTPNPSDAVEIKIVSAKFIESINSIHRAGNVKPTPVTSLRNPFGNLLEVKIVLTPKRSNSAWPGHFNWSSDWIGAVGDKGEILFQLGQMVGGKIDRSVSNSINRSGDGPWPSNPVTLYFSTPEKLNGFDLIYTWTRAASSKVEGD